MGNTLISPKVYGKETETLGWTTGDTPINVSTGIIVITTTFVLRSAHGVTLSNFRPTLEKLKNAPKDIYNTISHLAI